MVVTACAVHQAFNWGKKKEGKKGETTTVFNSRYSLKQQQQVCHIDEIKELEQGEDLSIGSAVRMCCQQLFWQSVSLLHGKQPR